MKPTGGALQECPNCGEAGAPGHHWTDDGQGYVCTTRNPNGIDSPAPFGTVMPRRVQDGTGTDAQVGRAMAPAGAAGRT